MNVALISITRALPPPEPIYTSPLWAERE